jgi:ATP-dependent DNA helicase RecG
LAIQNLPFKLTNKQLQAINQINQLNKSNYRESILLQGDVGSGKTIIALLTAMPFITTGLSSSIHGTYRNISSTNIENLKTFLKSSNIRSVLLTGSVKNKSEIYEKVQKKEINFIIGTHAIFQEKLQFNNLSYVIIDEQHRFGVQQRLSLAEKGINTNILLMSATPIPRTL